MAVNPQSGVLRRLEAEVTCPLCLEIFTEPKKLPCEHIYCKQCLRGLALRSITGSISCPECRTDTPVPPNFDVSQFVTPHQVNRLIEMYQQNLKLAENEASAPQPATCKVHKSQSLALYCETCESLVCRDCVLLSCAKKNHEHGFVEDMMKKYQTDLSKRLEPVRVLHQQMLNALEEISTRERQVENMKEVRLRQTEATFDALAEVLAQERRYFTESVKKSFKEQEKTNHSKKIEISEILDALNSTMESIENSFLNEPSVFLGDVPQKKQKIKLVEKLARKVSPQPAVLPQMQVELMDPAKFKEDCHISNYMYKMGDPLKSYFDRPADLNDLQVPINQTSTYTLHIDPSDVKVTVFQKITITARLHCHYDWSSEAVLVRKITPKQYSLSFVPHKRGRHELHITYNDTHICGSPIPIYVTIQPHRLREIDRRNFHVAGVACYGGKIYVCNPDSGLHILKSLSKPIERSIEIRGLTGVLVTQEHIYGTIAGENRVIKMDMNGTVIKSIGEKGDAPGQFYGPNGITQSKDKYIYISEIKNNRIQVFNEHLEVQRVISNISFYMPTDLDSDDFGNLYVADARNHRIQVLTTEGQHIRNIGTPGAEPGELQCPASTAIYKNMLYVTDSLNNRISVFKTTGEFVTTFGEGIIDPWSISIDEDGYIYVTNFHDKIALY